LCSNYAKLCITGLVKSLIDLDSTIKMNISANESDKNGVKEVNNDVRNG